MTDMEKTYTLADLRIRDPFIVPDEATQTYYLVASLPAGPEGRPAVGLYSSRDLETWTGPTIVFETPADFWAQGPIWAPELHRYAGKYYLFVTFNTDDPLPEGAPLPEGEIPAWWSKFVKRGSQVLVADSLFGPYRPFRNAAHTPPELMILDGTLWVEDGVPYMIYCHEWVQVRDGTIDLVRFTPDLSASEGEPVTLFKGSNAAWTRPGMDRYVTDGPFIYRMPSGKLLMLWATLGWFGYTQLMAISESGSIHGPWTQHQRPLFMDDGGHGMIFHRFDGAPMLTLHHPNHPPHERPLIFELEPDGDAFAIVRKPPRGYPFADPDLPMEARIDNLLSLMTVSEKINCLGTIPNVPRLSVWGTGHVEGLHGLAMGGPGGWGRPSPVPTTQFPQAIGLGETWDPDLIQQVAAVEGYETRYMAQSKRFRRGGLVVRAPNADLGRDIRWGRTEECYGEDAFFNGTMVTAFVKGLQGDHPRYWQTASLLKHFFANSNEDERESSSSDFDQRLFREYYSVPFRMGIMDGGARAYMAAYNAHNGIPCTVHPILKEITVKEWGQDGIICTDGGAFTLLVKGHHYYPDLDMAAAVVIKAGINQFLDRYRESVHAAVDHGWLTEADLDEVLRGVFRVMIKLGVLDPPEMVPYSAIGSEPELPWESEKHKALARLATQKSIVLLKNEGKLLPLDAGALKTIAVIGRRADEVLLDWYSGDPPYAVTALDGIRARVGDAVRVIYAKDNENDAAVNAAREADVAIVCVGNHPTGDAGWAQCPTPSDGKEAVDRRAIVLEQEELIKQVYRANPNTVVVLISSFPFAIVWTQRHVPAIVHMTHNSQELGNALADVLFGDVNPGGRLVQTWPHSIEQLPPRLDYDLRNGRTYMYFKGEPLYPFGFGLSYTTFAYSNLRLSAEHLPADGELTVSLDVTNTGDRAGDEVVQLYVKHLHSAVEWPKKELKGFKRITLQPGETQTVTFPLKAASLAYWEVERQRWVVEPGTVQLMLGSSSADTRLDAIVRVGVRSKE